MRLISIRHFYWQLSQNNNLVYTDMEVFHYTRCWKTQETRVVTEFTVSDSMQFCKFLFFAFLYRECSNRHYYKRRITILMRSCFQYLRLLWKWCYIFSHNEGGYITFKKKRIICFLWEWRNLTSLISIPYNSSIQSHRLFSAIATLHNGTE